MCNFSRSDHRCVLKMSILNLFPLGLQKFRRQKPALYLAFSHIAHFFGCAKLPQNKVKLYCSHLHIYLHKLRED